MHIQTFPALGGGSFLDATAGAVPIDLPAAHAARLAAKQRVREAMLAGPVLPTMLRLALPTLAVLVMQTLVTIAETYWVSFLGTAALAGVSLVFPVAMLMTMMSNGAIGGGVSSAVARELGAGRRANADALLWHAIVLSFIFGVLFATAALICGPLLYRALGGRGDVLQIALTYSAFIFAGSPVIWLVNLIASALRGAGDVKVPALVSLRRRANHDPALAGLHLRYRAGAALRRRGCRSRGVRVLRRGDRRAAAVRALGPLVAGVAHRARPRIAVSRDSRCRTALRGRHVADEHHRRVGDQRGRVFWNRGAGRIRYRIAPRLHPDPALVRCRHGRADDGRHERRRGQRRTGPADRVDRRGDRRAHDRRHRRRGGGVSGGLDRPLLARSGGAGDRHALPAARRTVLRVHRPRHAVILRESGRGPRAVAVSRRDGAPDGFGRGRLDARRAFRCRTHDALRRGCGRYGDVRSRHGGVGCTRAPLGRTTRAGGRSKPLIRSRDRPRLDHGDAASRREILARGIRNRRLRPGGVVHPVPSQRCFRAPARLRPRAVVLHRRHCVVRRVQRLRTSLRAAAR